MRPTEFQTERGPSRKEKQTYNFCEIYNIQGHGMKR